MYVRIDGIELKGPVLTRLIEPDGGLNVVCDAIKGKHDEAPLQKLMTYLDSTLQVKWQDRHGQESRGTMKMIGAKSNERKGPDDRIITNYAYTLTFI